MKVLDYTGTSHLVSKTKTELANKVDKVAGKGLSTNDYTDADKAELNEARAEIFCRNIYGGTPNVLYPCDIPNGTKVTISTADGSTVSTAITINLYKADKTRADYWTIQSYSARTITTNADIKYISLTASHTSPIQVEVGQTKTAYQAYFLSPKALTAKFDNIVNDDRVNALSNRAKLFAGNVEKKYVQGFLKTDGSINTQDSYHSQITDYIYVIPNEVFVYSGHGSSNIPCACFYDENLGFVSAYIPSISASPNICEITVPAGAVYARFSSRASDSSDIICELIVKPKQLEMYDNSLSLKKWYACGDSYTEGAYVFTGYNPPDKYIEEGKYANKLKCYPYFIGNRTNCDVNNIALSGSTLAKVTADDYSFSYEKYKTIPADADYITLWFGINDEAQSVVVGNDDDSTNATFKGAWNVVLGYLLENCPKAKIGIIVSNSLSRSYVDATITMAERWGVPYLDLNSDNVPLMQNTLRNVCDEAKQIAIDKFAISSSNMHPNYYAHEFESRFIENWMLGI